MIDGALSAVVAGVALALYALPLKLVRGYSYENSWSIFFLLTLVILPLVVGLVWVDDFFGIITSLPIEVLAITIGASFLCGVGMQFCSKSISSVGITLGLSIFLGTILLINSILPFVIDEVSLVGVDVVFMLLGAVLLFLSIFFYVRSACSLPFFDKSHFEGLSTAVIGGVFATGYSLANIVCVKPITDAVVAVGNHEWAGHVAVVCTICLGASIYAIPYFVIQLSRNNKWGEFRYFVASNLSIIVVTSVLFFVTPIIIFFESGQYGSVEYAAFNISVFIAALVIGCATKELKILSKRVLALALVAAVVGVILIAVGKGAA